MHQEACKTRNWSFIYPSPKLKHKHCKLFCHMEVIWINVWCHVQLVGSRAGEERLLYSNSCSWSLSCEWVWLAIHGPMYVALSGCQFTTSCSERKNHTYLIISLQSLGLWVTNYCRLQGYTNEVAAYCHSIVQNAPCFVGCGLPVLWFNLWC